MLPKIALLRGLPPSGPCQLLGYAYMSAPTVNTGIDKARVAREMATPKRALASGGCAVYKTIPPLFGRRNETTCEPPGITNSALRTLLVILLVTSLHLASLHVVTTHRRLGEAYVPRRYHKGLVVRGTAPAWTGMCSFRTSVKK